MGTVTKKDLIDRITNGTCIRRSDVRLVIQTFLDQVTHELAQGNRIEFRDFGVFEVRQRRGRVAQNPKTLEPVSVPPKRTVKFKVGREMRDALDASRKNGQSDALTVSVPSRRTARSA